MFLFIIWYKSHEFPHSAFAPEEKPMIFDISYQDGIWFVKVL